MRREQNAVCGGALWWLGAWVRRWGCLFGLEIESVQAPVLAMRSLRRGPHKDSVAAKDVRDDFHTTAMIYLNIRMFPRLGMPS